jgi:alpha-glucan,water dikinase
MWQPTPLVTTGPSLSVTQAQNGSRVTLLLETECPNDCVLHWGLSQRADGAWRSPPQECWPAGTTPVDGHAVRTPFRRNARGKQELRLDLELPCRWRNLVAVVHSPKENRWFKNGSKDFSIALPQQGNSSSPEEALNAWVPGPDVVRRAFPLTNGDRLATAVRTIPGAVVVSLVCDTILPVYLHWGLAPRFRQEWKLPGPESYPRRSIVVDQAVQTPFVARDGLQWLELQLPLAPDGNGPRGLRFVIYQPDDKAWLKVGGSDVYLPLSERKSDARLPSGLVRQLADEIIDVEVGASSWTLMHRYNLCHDLLARTQDDGDGLALLFAWLRYSATRQLDWQRHYNTKPSELANAQDRLTRRLASLWKRSRPELRLWPRLMLTTLGRGGDGQRVRDEILHIMHRNGLREVHGSFIEEWHQKLHNNTTLDDVAICEAYLEFFRSDGDLDAFYQTLEAKGVKRERLLSFERPIRTEPEFYADRRDALIPEFENFLSILKSVHSGTDLDTAAGAARGRLNGDASRSLDHMLALRNGTTGLIERVAALVTAREEIGKALAASQDDGGLRDLLFLDLALEEALRAAVEQQGLSKFERDQLVELIEPALHGLAASVDSEELRITARDWAAVRQRSSNGREWALQARSVTERAARWVQSFSDDVYRCLQPKAEVLGEACSVPKWVIALFSEEVIRGGPSFSLSLLLRHLDPLLRQAAGMSGWQIVSPGRAVGRVRAAESLLAVQQERFPEATVLLTDHVRGEEEVPGGVHAVLTTDAPDLVSHLAVRARNAGVLLATCFDQAVYQRLKEMQGKVVSLRSTPSGEVEVKEGGTSEATPDAEQKAATVRRIKRRSSAWVLTQDEFTPEVVGGKSNNLNGLRGKLPADIRLPASLALPFGVGERVLEDRANQAIRDQARELVKSADSNPPEVLARLRTLLLGLTPPAEMKEKLLQAWQSSGLASVPWDQAWRSIQRVWASKWNDRAYLSRRARGIAHDDLLMAVLIQQVVEADYAFVIHTTNPLTGNANELYAEVVLGLGETLVGNYPGRALGFVYRKADQAVEIKSFPGKSVGLYGKGVIFRSDSNGEDLEGFAGAGLYDSVLAEEPQSRLLSYAGEKLVTDAGFRTDLLRRIANVGLEVERVLGSPQDIEGAVAGGQMHVVQTRPQVGLEKE